MKISVVVVKGIQCRQRVASKVKQGGIVDHIRLSKFPALAGDADENWIPIQVAEALPLVDHFNGVETIQHKLLLTQGRAGKQLRTIVGQLAGISVTSV